MFGSEINRQMVLFNKGLFLFVVINFQVSLPQIWIVTLFILAAATCIRFSIELTQSPWGPAACHFKE